MNSDFFHKVAAVAGLSVFASLYPAALRAQTPDQVGQWSGVVNLPIVPIHVSLLPTGSVLMWNHAHSELVDPTTGKTYVQDNPTPYVWNYNQPAGSSNPLLVSVPGMFGNTHTDEIYCSGQTFLPDGTLLVAGGHMSKWNSDARGKSVNLEFTGSTQIHLFQQPGTWSLASAQMTNGRWYPTARPLGNGKTLVIGGIVDQNSSDGTYIYNLVPEIYDANAASIVPLFNASRRLLTYPWMYTAPSSTPGNRVFYAGPGPDTGFLDLSGAGAWGASLPSTFGVSRSPGAVHQATSVLYAPYKLLNIGGVNMGGLQDSQNYLATPTASAEIIDLNTSPAAWRAVAAMNRPRQFPTATVLPDGKVLVTGGKTTAGFDNADGAVMEAETWDPATQSWSLMASMSVPRLHHSFALLLPDGRVMVGGGGETGFMNEVSHKDVQFYSPPYLFKGARPVITSVSSSTVTYGQTFSIGMQSKNISTVTLIRIGSVTHGINLNQAVAQLKFKKDNRNDALDVTVPADQNLVPPGHYLLFVVNGAGVPSVAKIIQVTP